MFRYLIILIFLFVGCQRGPSLPLGIPPLTVCKITVTQNGEPLDGATLSLNTVAGTENWRVVGITDTNGVVVPSTNGLFEGVLQGKYKIVVSKKEQDASKLPPSPAMGEPGYEEWLNKYGDKIEKLNTYFLVEKQYTSASTTPHEIDVSGKKRIETAIDVGKKVREKM
ncbi:MAG: hypothetical protein LBN39_00225 [Planctomycetaceae bacterium]|jgi:hypothetical protein|nr:hypothetical protein [Planctomycetaceae bacterium]